MKVTTIDCQYVFPRFAAAFLVTAERDGRKRGVIIENNTAHSVPRILEAVRAEGLTPSDIDFLMVTHVHLDHAGGSSALMKECQGAKLLAHPRATPHLIDPSKLVSSARQVYGDEIFDQLYGKIEALPSERVQAMQDGETLDWHGVQFSFLHTRGHANHHFCVLASEQGQARGVFTGDAFGLAYPDLQAKGLFIFPSTSPTDFDATEARKSIVRIHETGAPVAYLTHFGAVDDLDGASRQLLEGIDFSENLLNAAIQSSEPDQGLESFCEEKIQAYFMDRITGRGLSWEDARKLLKFDLELNAAGIAHVARKRREREKIKEQK